LRLRRALLSLFLAASIPAASFAVSVPALAQSASGSISGTVASGDQTPLAGAAVKLSGPVSQTATSAANGTFSVTGLPDGVYSVSISRSGYDAVTGTTVTISGGAPQTLAITLVASSLTSLRTIGSVVANGGRASTALNTSAAAQVTLTSSQFTDRGQTQVVNMLEEQPGVDITRNSSGAPGANSDVAIRGTNPYETQVLVDGHPVNGGDRGQYDITFLNPLILSDVEIDKGPGAFPNSVENAIGGSVNFRTPPITSTPTGTVLAGFDSFYGSEYGARYSTTIGKVGFLLGYAFVGTPGYLGNQGLLSVTSANGNATSVPGMPPLVATVNTGIVSSQVYQNKSELAKLGYNFSPTTTLTAGFYGSQSTVDYSATDASQEPYTIVASCGPPTCTSTNFTNPFYANLVGQTVLASNGKDDLFNGNSETDNEPIFTVDLRSGIGTGTFLARYYAGSITRLLNDPGEITQISGCPNPACNPATTLGSNFNEQEIDQLHGGDFEYDQPIGLSTLTLSYDRHADSTTFCESTSTPPCLANALIVASTTYSVRGYIPISHKLTFGLGNYFSSTSFVGNRYDPRASLTYQPSKYQSIRLAAGSAFVAPPAGFVGAVAGPNGALVGASVTGVPGPSATLNVIANLKPETSQSFDIGTDIATGTASKFTLDFYNTVLKNRFETETVNLTGGTVGTFNGLQFGTIKELFNVSDSHEQGVEIGFIKAPKVGFGTTLDFDLSNDYDFNTVPNPLAGATASAAQTSTFNNLGSIKDNTQIPGFAYSKGRAEINYAFASGARAAFGMSYYGNYNSFGEPAFTMFDANFGIPLAYGFRLQVSGINIFDHDGGRNMAEFDYGPYTPIGLTSPVTLFFAPPRQVTFQLSHPL
jgi:hypothetical protein